MTDKDYLVLNEYLSEKEFDENSEIEIVKKKIKLLVKQISLNEYYTTKMKELQNEMVVLNNGK